MLSGRCGIEAVSLRIEFETLAGNIFGGPLHSSSSDKAEE